MEKESGVGLFKIELNKWGDYIEIPTTDTGFFDRFVETYRQIVNAARELPGRYREIDEARVLTGHENKTVEKIRAKVRFCEEAAERIDSVFGQGTLKKYFREHYADIPDFMPGAECFIDFFEEMAPVLENLFGRKVYERDKADIMSMSQYTDLANHNLNGQRTVFDGRKRRGRKR